jgi:hypothetical protein
MWNRFAAAVLGVSAAWVCACGQQAPEGAGTDGSEDAGGSATAPTGPGSSSAGGSAPATAPGSSDASGTSESSGGGVEEGPDPGSESGVDPPPNIVVDHGWVDRFDDIPEQYVAAAASTPMFFMDRSVGGNIDEGLHCLAASFEDAPNHCGRSEHPADPAFSVDPALLHWNGTYDRSLWAFEFWPEGCGDAWSGKVECFKASLEPRIDDYDVVSFQLSYLAVVEGSDVADPSTGFFVEQADRSDVWDYLAFGETHGKTLIYWTSSLARGIGTAESDAFNEQMRQWTAEHDVPLFDVADILSHDPDGAPCWDNRDGVPYVMNGNVEDHPDDGVQHLAICPHYTTELDGGHLGSVSAGKIRVAKGFWVLMARIAGWEP